MIVEAAKFDEVAETEKVGLLKAFTLWASLRT